MSAPIAAPDHAPIERTEHPHVVRNLGILGGKSRIEGTRISVGHVFVLYRDNGDSAESIAATYDLKLAHVLDALSYAYDHSDEMEDFEERQKLRTILGKNEMVYAGGHLFLRERIGAPKVPEGTLIYTWENLPTEYAY